MFVYIADKLSECSAESVCRPYKAGFYKYPKQAAVFITSDYKYGSDVTDDHRFNLHSKMSDDEVLKDFIRMIDCHTNKCQCMLLCCYRISGLLFSNYSKNKLNKILVTNRKADEYLQVFNRDSNTECYQKIEQSEKSIYNSIFNCRDEVLLFKDITTDYGNEKITAAQRKSAMSSITVLKDTFIDNKSFSVTRNRQNILSNAECMCSITGNYAPFFLDSNDRIDICLEDTSMEHDEIKKINYEFDKLIVRRFLGDKNEALKMTITFNSIGHRYKNNPYRTLIAVYTYLMNYIFTNEIKPSVTIKEFSEYILELEDSQNNLSDSNYLLEQAVQLINSSVLDSEIQIINTDKIFSTNPAKGKTVVYYDEEYLYFDNKIFSKLIAEKITGRINELEIKQLLQENYFLCDELSVRKQFSGKGSQTRYTGISVSILSHRALEHLPYRYSNFVPCDDDKSIQRVSIGLDEKGKQLYWSMGHNDTPNLTMLVTGSPKNGKNTFVNLLTKKLHNYNNNVIYLDTTGSCTYNEFIKTGMSSDFISKNIMWHNIKDLIDSNNDDMIGWMLQDMVTRRKIIVVKVDENEKATDKRAMINMFLRALRNYCNREHSFSAHLVLDEIDTLDLGENSTIRDIILRDRKKGLSLIMIAPQIYSLNRSKRDTLLKASMKIYFNIDSETEQKKIAESFSKGNVARLSNMLGELKKGEFIAHGSFEDANGEVCKRIIKARNDFTPKA